MAPAPLRSLRIVAAALAFASVTTYAQTLSPAVEVQRLAPQLVQFAGSLANFQSLANGLALGLPVTLTSVTPDGFLQTVTFTPAATQAPVDVARSLERARQA